MKHLTVRHVTTYRYAHDVTFGPHRLMMRPRDSHDLRLVSSELGFTPVGTLRWFHDVFGNSVTIIDFTARSNALEIVSTLELERFGLERPRFSLDSEAATYPFIYSNDERTDLSRLLEQHYPDPKDELSSWARQFVRAKGMDTLELLAGMNAAVQANFKYMRRDDEGTQPPTETLRCGSGSCRDFALLLIEAVRSLGFGARFVTGYLYDPSVDASGLHGAGATHAWADIYLPGAGWVEYDPTNGLIAGENLIRVAVTRDPSQAVPVAGSFVGEPSSYLGMSVQVTVASDAPIPTTGVPVQLQATSLPVQATSVPAKAS